MARRIGPVGVSSEEWAARVWLAGRVRELLGTGSVGRLQRRLGDNSRTRSHKILNPDPDRGVGQSVTLALLQQLAQAFDVPLLRFLAPILSADEEALQDEVHHQRQAELMAKTNALIEQETAQLERPAAKVLVMLVAAATQQMTDAELNYECTHWELWSRRWGASRRPLAGEAFQLAREQAARKIEEDDHDGEAS